MTEIKASPETVRAVASALGRARLFDDKLGGSDEGRIAAWAEACEPHKLSQRDMLEAVTDYYSTNPNGRTMQVSDLIRLGRQARGERNQRESDEERNSRAERLERKADPDETRAVLGGFVGGAVKDKTERLVAAEEALEKCTGRADAMAAIAEFFDAKREAKKLGGMRAAS